jgi:hypothetical protein
VSISLAQIQKRSGFEMDGWIVVKMKTDWKRIFAFE